MKELVNNWNEKHPEYVLVHGMYSYVDNGQSKDMHMLTIFNNECICEYKGEDFIKLYNTLEEEWEDAHIFSTPKTRGLLFLEVNLNYKFI